VIQGDKNRLLLAFVGLSCCEFFADKTCSKGGNNVAVTSTKYGVMKCLGYNSRHMDNKSWGFDAGMLRLCMLGESIFIGWGFSISNSDGALVQVIFVSLLSNLIYLAFRELVSLHVGCVTT
jgi:hypothetical protein